MHTYVLLGKVYQDFYVTSNIFRKKYNTFAEATAIWVTVATLPIHSSLITSLPLPCTSLCDQLTLTLLMTKIKSNFKSRSPKRRLLPCRMPQHLGTGHSQNRRLSPRWPTKWARLSAWRWWNESLLGNQLWNCPCFINHIF